MNEACDDGDVNHDPGVDGDGVSDDGCSADCMTVEYGFVCTDVADALSVCASTCGDKRTAFDEICDDGNTDNDDGCQGDCLAEFVTGYVKTAGDPNDLN